MNNVKTINENRPKGRTTPNQACQRPIRQFYDLQQASLLEAPFASHISKNQGEPVMRFEVLGRIAHNPMENLYYSTISSIPAIQSQVAITSNPAR